MLKNLKEATLFSRVFFFLLPPAWEHIDCMRAEEKLKCLFPARLTSLTLALSNLCHAKSPCDRSQHKVVLGCMRRAHFLMPPSALLNHLVRGAQTMVCMALKGHYNIALSTFTATKLNGPYLRGGTKQSTTLMSCKPQIRLDSAGRFFTMQSYAYTHTHTYIDR